MIRGETEAGHGNLEVSFYRLTFASSLVEAVAYDLAGEIPTEQVSALILAAAQLERVAKAIVD